MVTQDSKSRFCDKLSGDTCTFFQKRCFRLGARTICEYYKGYYPIFTKIGEDTKPIARKTIENMLPRFLEKWKMHEKPGDKRVVATPFEEEMRKILKSELSSLDVNVSDTAKNVPLWEGCSINADCVAEKPDYPKTILSFKTWIGKEQIRETFASDYWAKTWLGLKNVKAYQIGIIKTSTKAGTIEKLIEFCKPYIDGVFFLTNEPYVDDLIEKLKVLYSEPSER